MLEKVNGKIRQIRELKNYSQEFIAKELNISIRAYSKIENGDTQLTIKRLNEISKILGVTPHEILGFNADIMFKDKKNYNSSNIPSYQLDAKLLQELYEKLLAEKDEAIKLLKKQI